MSNVMKGMILVLIILYILYIVSPIDACLGAIDDLIVCLLALRPEKASWLQKSKGERVRKLSNILALVI